MAKRPSSDDIDRFLEYGVDLVTRTVLLTCASYDETSGDGNGVDYLMAAQFIKNMHLLESRAPDGDKPITILANNPGGSWHHGMAIFGTIKACKNHVTIKMRGQAMSMGAVIPQAADERVIDPYCRFMLHYGTDAYDGHTKNMVRWTEETKRLNLIMEDIFLERLLAKDQLQIKKGNEEYIQAVFNQILNKHHTNNVPKDSTPEPKYKLRFSNDPQKRVEDIRQALRLLLDFDTILSPQEAVALGFADRVADE